MFAWPCCFGIVGVTEDSGESAGSQKTRLFASLWSRSQKRENEDGLGTTIPSNDTSQ